MRDRSPVTCLALASLLAVIFSYFVAFSIILTMLPFAARAVRMPATAVGAVLAILGGAGLVLDPLTGALANKIGRPALVAIGGIVGTLGSLGLARELDPLTVTIYALFAAIATSCIVNPALSALSEQRGPQPARVQGSNATVQRLGSLVAAATLALLLTERDLVSLQLIVAGGYLAVAACACLITSDGRVPASSLTWASVRTAYASSYTLTLKSPGVAHAALVNCSLAIFFLVGSSFYPILAVDEGHGSIYVGTALGLRDLLAVAAGLSFPLVSQRFGIRATWIWTASLGLLTLGGSIMTSSMLLGAALFSVHGAAIGFGIAIANTHIADATTDQQRIFGFAAVAIASRVVNLLVPLLLGTVLAVGSPRLTTMAGAAIGVSLLIVYILVGRRHSLPHSSESPRTVDPRP